MRLQRPSDAQLREVADDVVNLFFEPRTVQVCGSLPKKDTRHSLSAEWTDIFDCASKALQPSLTNAVCHDVGCDDLVVLLQFILLQFIHHILVSDAKIALVGAKNLRDIGGT